MTDDGKARKNYDVPTYRRDSAGRSESGDETPKRRRTMREREIEEEEELRAARRGKWQSRRRDEAEDDYDEEEEGRAPKIVRVFSWVALMLILFAVGYLATNYFFAWSDKKGGERVGGVYGSPSEVKERSAVNSASTKKYTIYIPSGGGFSARDVEIRAAGTEENDMEEVMSMYVDGMKETKQFANEVEISALFRSGDWLYLDMTPAFSSSLKSLGREKSERLLSGFVKTAAENFPPVKKIKFYVNSKEITDKKPVDLSSPWEKTE